MTVSTHTYTLTVKRAGKRDAVLRIIGGRISLDAGRAPHVVADIRVAVPSEWAPLEPISTGHWEPTGEPQFDFIPEEPGDSYMLSNPAFIWVEDDPQLWVDPDDDPIDPEAPEPEIIDFIPDEPGDAYYPTPVIYVPPPRPPKPADLLDIDPRDLPRLVLTAIRVDASGTQQRDFDLTLRERAVAQRDGTVTLQLASDEAILADFAPLVDDATPFDLASSLQYVCNYVLGVAIPGAHLGVSSNADVTPGWSTTNLIPNPGPRTFTHSTAAGAQALTSTTEVPARAGSRSTLSLKIASPNAMRVAIAIQFVDDAGTILSTTTSEEFTASSGGFRLRLVSDQAPAGTTHAVPIVIWSSSAAGRTMAVSEPVFVDGIFDPGPFDGSTPETARYRYSWEGTPSASPSRRTLIGDAPDPEALVWKAGTSGLEFLSPLVQSAGLRLVCTEDRAWSLRASEWQAPSHAAVTYGVDMIDGSDKISRTDDTWFDAAVVVYSWTDRDGIARTRTDAYALQTPHTKTRRFDRSTPYPGPGFAQYAVTRAQNRGRQVEAIAVSDWTLHAETPVKVILNGARPQLGKVQDLTYDLDHDEMTINTRTIDEGAGDE